MLVTVLLGGNLRNEATKGPQERTLELHEASQVSDLVDALGLPPQRLKMIMVNHRGATLRKKLHDGDRVAFFPPELSYNTFVSLSFRQERVASCEED
jgi:molybdopterin converting factor small subunit